MHRTTFDSTSGNKPKQSQLIEHLVHNIISQVGGVPRGRTVSNLQSGLERSGAHPALPRVSMTRRKWGQDPLSLGHRVGFLSVSLPSLSKKDQAPSEPGPEAVLMGFQLVIERKPQFFTTMPLETSSYRCALPTQFPHEPCLSFRTPHLWLRETKKEAASLSQGPSIRVQDTQWLGIGVVSSCFPEPPIAQKPWKEKSSSTRFPSKLGCC